MKVRLWLETNFCPLENKFGELDAMLKRTYGNLVFLVVTWDAFSHPSAYASQVEIITDCLCSCYAIILLFQTPWPRQLLQENPRFFHILSPVWKTTVADSDQDAQSACSCQYGSVKAWLPKDKSKMEPSTWCPVPWTGWRNLDNASDNPGITSWMRSVVHLNF